MRFTLSGRGAAARFVFLVGTLGGLAVLTGGCGGGEQKTAETAPKTDTAQEAGLTTVDQRVSYGIGYNIGSNVSRQGGVTIDEKAILAGLQDGLKGETTRVSEADLQAAFAEAQEKASAENAKKGEANLAAAKTFLEQNRSKAGVRVTDSGLQYEVLESGSGPRPERTDTVKVHYHGTLPDGTVFDSSVERGEPIEFPVTGVIPGWVEALQMMSVGDKWRLTIPPELGYGPRAAGKIPPNSALIFEVELLEIK